MSAEDHKHHTEPEYYQVVDYIVINTSVYKLPKSFGSSVTFVEFKAGDMHDPNVDPLLCYYNAGTKQIMWRDTWWSQCDIDLRHLINEVKSLYLAESITYATYDKVCHMIDNLRGKRKIYPPATIDMRMWGTASYTRPVHNTDVITMYRIK